MPCHAPRAPRLHAVLSVVQTLTLPDTTLSAATDVTYLFPADSNVTLAGHALLVPISISTPIGADASFTAAAAAMGASSSAKTACTQDFTAAFQRELSVRLRLGQGQLQGINCSATVSPPLANGTSSGSATGGRRRLRAHVPQASTSGRSLQQAAYDPACNGNATLRMTVALSFPYNASAEPLDAYRTRMATILAAWAAESNTTGLAICPTDASQMETSAQLSVTYRIPLNAAGASVYSGPCGTNAGTRTVEGLENLKEQVACGVSEPVVQAKQESAVAPAAAGGGGAAKGGTNLLAIIIGCSVGGGVALLLCAALAALVVYRKRKQLQQARNMVGLCPSMRTDCA